MTKLMFHRAIMVSKKSHKIYTKWLTWNAQDWLLIGGNRCFSNINEIIFNIKIEIGCKGFQTYAVNIDTLINSYISYNLKCKLRINKSVSDWEEHKQHFGMSAFCLFRKQDIQTSWSATGVKLHLRCVYTFVRLTSTMNIEERKSKAYVKSSFDQ